MTKQITASAPGRICLFGEHQDFLGLWVIACPIDLTIDISGRPNGTRAFRIDMPDLCDRDEFETNSCDVTYKCKRDYLRSTVNVLQRKGLRIESGYDCEIYGRIPINAGTSSSSALVVAWAAFLLATQKGDVPCSPQDIACCAHQAEVLEFKEPGGMMDHYTSALGGLLHIDCCEPVSFTRLQAQLDGFVLGNTGVPKPTTSTLRQSRDEAREGLAILAEHIKDFDLRTTPIEQAEEYFHLLPKNIRRRVRANFINRDLCKEAYAMLSRPDRGIDQVRLGEMLYEHQQQLRDGIDVSHERLDVLIEAAMNAGALGGKLNGSGCGGCMFAYAPGKQQQVAEAIEAAGGEAFVVSVSDGVRVEQEATVEIHSTETAQGKG